MPKYNVHIYAIVRVAIEGVEADSPEAAAKIADERTDLHLACPSIGEYAESVDGYMVDELGEDGDPLSNKSVNLTAQLKRENIVDYMLRHTEWHC